MLKGLFSRGKSGPSRKESTASGLFEQYCANGLGAEGVDIVFVHGLNGDAFDTWTSNGVFWPKELLPIIAPRSRIFTYGYNANLWFDTANGSIRIFAENLIVQLKPYRKDSSKNRPIIFIAHSLGGIVVKRALIFARSKPGRYQSILDSTRSIVFMGTPHQGSSMATYGEYLSTVWNSVRGASASSSTKQLKTFSETLRTITGDFVEIAHGMDIMTFYELVATQYVGLVVQEWSARMNIHDEVCVGLNADHRNLCRFYGDDDPVFRIVSVQLKELIDKFVPPPPALSLQQQPQPEQEQFNHHRLPPPLQQQHQHQQRLSSLEEQQREREQQEKLHALLPAFHDSNLYYRDGYIEQISLTFGTRLDEECLRVHGLHGTGGVGKSQIALKCAHKAVEQGIAVFWLQADQDTSLLDGVEQLAAVLYPDSPDTKRKPVFLFNQWLFKNRNWIIVFDNVDSISALKRYWPNCNHGSILITTRDPGIFSSQLGDKVSQTRVEPFTEEEGISFIERQMPTGSTDRIRAKELVLALGGLPIALWHATGYMKHTECTLQDFMDLSGIREMIYDCLFHYKDKGESFNYERPFEALFESSLNALAGRPEAIRLLHFMALLNPDSIEESLVKTVANGNKTPYSWQLPGKYILSFGDLKSHSLIVKDTKKGTLSFHRLVRWAVLKNWTADEWQRNFHETFNFLDSLFPRQVKGRSLTAGAGHEQCRRVAFHVEALEKGYRQGKAHLTGLVGFANLLANCGFYMYELGLNRAAFNILESAREICQKEIGNEPNLTHALVLNNLAVIHSFRNEPKRSIELEQQVVDWRRALLDPNDIELGNSLNNLATSYYDLEDVATARVYYEQALRIYETAKEADAEVVGMIAANLGKTETVLGEYEEAEAHIYSALRIHRRVFGAHYQTSCTLYRLALLRVSQGRYMDAKEVADEIVDMREQHFDPLNAKVGVAYHKRASILRRLGKYSDAVVDVEKAIAAFEASEDNCEPGLLPRSLFLHAFLLDDIYQATNDASFGRKAREKLDVALEVRLKRMDKARSDAHANEEDVNRLVQPDFR